MIDTKLLKAHIEQSGKTIEDIASSLGISAKALLERMENKKFFKASEIYALCDILDITDNLEKTKIFYSES